VAIDGIRLNMRNRSKCEIVFYCLIKSEENKSKIVKSLGVYPEIYHIFEKVVFERLFQYWTFFEEFSRLESYFLLSVCENRKVVTTEFRDQFEKSKTKRKKRNFLDVWL